jgi:P27 family predicted phage terminase small subunit
MRQRGRKSAASLEIPTPRLVVPDPPRTELPPPPEHLSPAMQDWWNSVAAEIDLEPHRLRLLQLACEAWDRCHEAREALAEHGLTYLSRDGDPRPRPEVVIERDARAAFARLVCALNLDAPIPQPPNAIGWRPPPRRPWD